MTDVHALRNRLTTAALTVTAMIDDKLPSTRANLQRVAQTLSEIRAIVAGIRSDEWGASADSLVDLQVVADRVIRAMMMLSAAADVKIEIAAAPEFAGCRALHADPVPIYRALDGALQLLLRAAPAGSTIVVAQASTSSIRASVRTPNDGAMRDLLEPIAQCLAAQGGSAHPLATERNGYCFHFPGAAVCGCAADPACE